MENRSSTSAEPNRTDVASPRQRERLLQHNSSAIHDLVSCAIGAGGPTRGRSFLADEQHVLRFAAFEGFLCVLDEDSPVRRPGRQLLDVTYTQPDSSYECDDSRAADAQAAL